MLFQNIVTSEQPFKLRFGMVLFYFGFFYLFVSLRLERKILNAQKLTETAIQGPGSHSQVPWVKQEES